MATEHFLALETKPADPGETRRALESLWKKVTSRPLWLPPNLLRYLELRRNVSLEPVTARNVRVTAPTTALPHCRACTDNCCIGKNNTVSLRLVDVATLIDLDRTALMRTDKPTFTQAELEQSPARALFVNSRGFNRLPVLGQDERQRCLALTADNRCSLWPNWPLACARFPYALDLDDGEVFYSKRCGSHRSTAANEKSLIKAMVDAALGSYNERIRDNILLVYAKKELHALGIGRFLK